MRRRIRMVLLAVILVLVSGLTSGIFAQGQIDVSGSIKGPDGGPKRFASVQMEGPLRYVAITDAEGQFSVSKVVPGRYTVRVRQGDYVATFSVDIRTDRLDLVVRW